MHSAMFVFFLVAFFSISAGSPDAQEIACARDPALPYCQMTQAGSEPFPELMQQERDQDYQRSVKKDYVTPLPDQDQKPPPRSPFGPSHELPQESEHDEIPPNPNSPPQNVQELQELCHRFDPVVRIHCNGPQTAPFYTAKCEGYFKDCTSFIPKGDPLVAVAHRTAEAKKTAEAIQNFNSGVDLNYGSAAVKGIPYYPINEEGAIEAANTGKVGFGSWGGGYSGAAGVRDYWSQHGEYGANVKEGKFGYQTGWSVPLVQSLGVEGGGGTSVSVPLKKEEFGKKPIDIDTGYGVGGYYKHNDHVGVDWKGGNVGHNFGVGVPFAGVGFNQGFGIHFPSVDTFMDKLTPPAPPL